MKTGTRLWLSTSMSVLMAGAAAAQAAPDQTAPARPDWENPAVNHIGAEPMHTSFAGVESHR